MKFVSYSLILSCVLALSHTANAAGSMLRVSCEGDDIGAEILINGKFRGECPMDVQVPAGLHNVLVQKSKRGDKYLFEQKIRLADDGLKKIEAKLIVEPFFNNLKNAEAGDLDAMLALTMIYEGEITAYEYADKTDDEKYKYAQEQLFKWNRKLAEAGRPAEMFSVAEAYLKGTGVEADKAEAERWFKQGFALARQKADSGDADSMVVLGRAYFLGKNVPKDKAAGMMWFRKARQAGSITATKLLNAIGENNNY